MEGRFYRNKTAQHPHLNMAKAALNMMTRTSGKEYKDKYGIIMVSVDTSWQNNYNYHSTEEDTWSNPVDYIDGAARILDPIFSNSLLSGVFLKDYKVTTW
jgi:NAD(P)-dependent dehydrogenase (short-subunit alcohol dehydrogenase family)